MNKKGFTLVELAIVLVIIGLLVGGVLQGQELIQQSQIRNVIARTNQYDTAVNTFRSKYDQMPGDFSRANAFGINHLRGVVATNVAATNGNLVGDGDNNGFLSNNGGVTTAAFAGEIANFWVHLSNEGLVRGTFVQPAAYGCPVAGTAAACTNPPLGRAYPDAVVGTGILALSEGNRLFYVIGVGNNISNQLGRATAVAVATSVRGDNLTPEQASSMDQKLDNGTADQGNVQVIEGYSATGVFDVILGTPAQTATTTCQLNGMYNVAVQNRLCTIRVRASS